MQNLTKYLLISCFLILCLPNVYGQKYFEGVAKYQVTVLVRDKQMKRKEIEEFDNKIFTFYFKNGNFKWEWPSSVLEGQLYIQKENNAYMISKDRQMSVWWDNSMISDSLIQISLSNEKISVLNDTCDLMTIITKSLFSGLIRTRTYAYTDKYRINPNWFINCNESNLNKVYRMMKVIPLQIIDDYGKYQITYTALEVSPKPLPSSIFKIDPQSQLVERSKILELAKSKQMR